ncbi:NAD(P)/FAD-dependent oxidoreductase [Tepidicella baoligensis]|uniref:NAD(P)/FAD-dependent oxidoreductase n=1 Tax=Tepidicella baoligensis TaxID=2707016 RepID=UPI0015D9A4F2|nr:NAD(P)/FAD-dependent oxidoreductase [Tepidicella baoligensis]
MIDTDAVIIGAGPVGLFQAFQLGLQEIRAHLIDALPHPGGQCAELYPDKPIYDIPGLPLCSGQELTDRLLQQIAPFQVPMHLGQAVQSLESLPDGRWQIGTTAGMVWRAPTVFIAAGVGAFVPRKPPLDGLEVFEQGPNAQVRYFGVTPASVTGQHVVVMGGENEALETALQLAEAGSCASLTLLHRVDKFRADAALEQAIRSAIDKGRLRLVLGQPLAIEQRQTTEGRRLDALHLATPDGPEGATTRLPLDVLLPRLGLSPKLGPITDWGLAMERKQLVVDTERFATSAPGIFAVGDINTYPGKRKLILCGFHEATLAAFAAAAIVHPERRVLLQYTTTSPRLHELLGVKPTPA